MKISLICFGSRADTHPPLVLAERLTSLGHDVTVAVPTVDLEPARAVAATVIEIPGGPRQFADNQRVQAMLKAGNVEEAVRESAKDSFPHQRGRMAAVDQALTGAELALVPPMLEDTCVMLAEKHRVRLGFSLYYPTWANSRYPAIGAAHLRPPRSEYLATHQPRSAGHLPSINVARKRLGLGEARELPLLRFREQQPPCLYYLPHELLPAPPEFGANHVFTGFLSYSPRLRAAVGEQALPSDLSAFLDRGPPPLFVSFGSVPVLDRDVVDLFIDVAGGMGHRLVFGKGWSSVDIPASEHVFAIGGVNHDKLLPRCAAFVHHGSLGSAGTALQLGIPSLAIPVAWDQPVWAERLRELGVGVELPYQALDRPSLTRALAQVLSPSMREAAVAFARRLAAQPEGVGVAAGYITEHADRFPIPDAAD